MVASSVTGNKCMAEGLPESACVLILDTHRQACFVPHGSMQFSTVEYLQDQANKGNSIPL